MLCNVPCSCPLLEKESSKLRNNYSFYNFSLFLKTFWARNRRARMESKVLTIPWCPSSSWLFCISNSFQHFGNRICISSPRFCIINLPVQYSIFRGNVLCLIRIWTLLLCFLAKLAFGTVFVSINTLHILIDLSFDCISIYSSME